MCGINGLLFKQESNELSEQLSIMNNLIIHRGPDDDGFYLYGNRLGMGMRRLSIIDLEHGKQPIQNENGTITIVFNGEIYNYKELKAEQEQKGVHFKTSSDTEVILSLYETYGSDCLHKLNGMFAFSIHDLENKTLFIARDRFGEKPLYFHHDKDKVVYASELKSIIRLFPKLKKINKEALNVYFALTYIPAPYTIYEDVQKLRPGYFIKIDTETLEKEEKCYWDIDSNVDVDPSITYSEAKRTTEQLLFESVEKRMIADVPLGVFLSGGVDSTIIAAIMSKISTEKIKTFSVGFKNKKYDESARAKLVADHVGSEHHEYRLNYEDLYNQVNNLVLNYDEPFADSSCIPTYFIAQKTAKHVKVAITGDGGDEVFGGYNKYMSIRYRKLYQKYVPGIVKEGLSGMPFMQSLLTGKSSKSIFTKAGKMLASVDLNLVDSHLNLLSLGFQDAELTKLINPEHLTDYKLLLKKELKAVNTSFDELKQLRHIDKIISLEGDMLVKVDRASMLSSLECRSPFLDHRLMEFTYKIPDGYLIDGNNKKRILKDTFKNLLPDNFFNAPKSGFEIPVGDWFRGEMKQEINQILSVENLEQHNLLNVSYIRKLLDEHISLKADHSWKLWTLFCFQKWYVDNFIANA